MKQTPRIPAMFVGIAIIGLLAAILLGPLTFAGASGQRQQERSLPGDGAASAALAQASPEGSPAATPVGTPIPDGWLAISKVDADGQPVAGACFSVFVDAGGGEWGRVAVMGDLCDASDGQSDGRMISPGLQPGDYVLVESFAPEGYAPAPDLLFSIVSGVTTEVIVEDPLPGTLVVRKVAEGSGEPLSGACFQLYRVRPNGERHIFVVSGCDVDGDGLTALGEGFSALAGPYILAEATAPDGYLPAPDQLVEVAPGAETTVTVGDRPGAVVVITKTDQDGAPVLGACFALLQPVDANETGGGDVRFVAGACDGSGGSGEIDGVIALGAVPTGDYILTESLVPPGYLPMPDRPLHLTEGETVPLTIGNQIGGSIVIHKTDEHGDPLGGFVGACFGIWTAAVDGDRGDFVTEACDGSDGPSDGTITLVGLVSGDYILVETRAPDGYIPLPDQVVSVLVGEATTLTLANQPGGKVEVTKLDEQGDRLPGACFLVRAVFEDGAVGGIITEACDSTDGRLDGVTRLAGQRLGLDGTYRVEESVAPAGYTAGPGAQVRVLAGEVTQLTVTDEVAVGTGVIRVLKVDDLGDPLPFACFEAHVHLGDGTAGDLLASACDADDGADGTIRLTGLPPDQIVLVESNVPNGFLPAENTVVEVVAGATTTVEVTNQLSGEAGSLKILKLDENGQPLPGACFDLYADALGGFVRRACDEFDAFGNDGTIRVFGLAESDYLLVEFEPPRGYLPVDDQVVHVTAGVTTSLTIEDPVGGRIVVHKRDEAGAPLRGSCFAVVLDPNNPDGTRVDGACDGFNDGDDRDNGVIAVIGMTTGDYYLVETRAPQGYALADPVPFHIDAGQTLDQEVINRVGGTVVIHKVDQDGAEIPDGGCFVVAIDSGGGTPGGTVTDERCGQPTTLAGLRAGSYVLVETRAPDGYVRGSDVPFSITLGETKEFTVANELGGTVIVRAVDTEGNPLGIACFDLYTDAGGGARGELIHSVCNDTLMFIGLAAGDYVLVEAGTPQHYFPAADIPFHVELGETKSFDVVNERRSTIIVHKVDPDGQPVLDACFEIVAIESTVPPGTSSGGACDFSDGTDGIVTIEGPGTGTYALVETNVPFGYLKAEDMTFTIAGGETKEFTIANPRAGMLIVHKVDEAGAPLLGACFAVYTDAGSGVPGDPVTGACDSSTGPDDGDIPMAPLTTGDYVLVEQFPLPGYFQADNVPFSIATGETKDVTVVNRRGGVLVVHKVDRDGNSLSSVCFAAYEDIGGGQTGALLASACDFDDGTLELAGFRTGNVVLVETDPPPGYSVADPLQLRMVEGKTREVTVVNKRKSGEILLHKVDEAGVPLTGTCFALYTDAGQGSPGTHVVSACDDFDGGDDGTLPFADLNEGNYVLVETGSPPGFEPSEPVPVRVRSDRTTEITVENRRMTGALAIQSAGPNGESLSGACYSVWSVKPDGSRDRRLGRACDGDDGVTDGVTTIIELLPGDVIVRQDRAPSGYRRADDGQTTVVSGETVALTLVSQPEGGSGEANQRGREARTEQTPAPAVPTATPEPTEVPAEPTSPPEPAPTPTPEPTPTPVVAPIATATPPPEVPLDAQREASPEAANDGS